MYQARLPRVGQKVAFVFCGQHTGVVISIELGTIYPIRVAKVKPSSAADATEWPLKLEELRMPSIGVLLCGGDWYIP